MKRIILIAISSIIWQITFAQNQKLEVEGAIIISNSTDPNPVEGTIRWTGQDFEGYDGTRWKSLTNCTSDPVSTEPVMSCSTQNVDLTNCSFVVSWDHPNPTSQTVNYDLRINGIDPGPSVSYPTTSNSVNICSLLGISSGSGTFEVELLYWYDGDLDNIDSTDVCTINYNFQPNPTSGLYEIDPAFSVTDLPTTAMQQAHTDWWLGYQRPDLLFESTPDELFAPADVNNWKSNGTYSIARHGMVFLFSITDLIRTTGDPNALNELIAWSQQIRTNLKDHDGRGYKYFEYSAVLASSEEDNRHNLDDTHFLDEMMLSGSLAHIAYVMHLNRNLSANAAVEADFWFKYLDENWLPKWLYRTSFGTANQVTPDASLGLQNAVNWDGGIGGTGGNAGDIVLWGAADAYDSVTQAPRFNNVPGIVHKFPAHPFGHPYIMSAYMYHVMGKYFQDTGKSPKGAYLTGTAQDYVNEAQTRHDWWYNQIHTRSDGSFEWKHFMNYSNSPMLTINYSQYVCIYLSLSHWASYGNFGNDTDMQAYAKVLYSGNPADATDFYDPNNVQTMRRLVDGSGGTSQFKLMGMGMLSPWDTTGMLNALNKQVTVSPTSHHMYQHTWRHHMIHYSSILSYERYNN